MGLGNRWLVGNSSGSGIRMPHQPVLELDASNSDMEMVQEQYNANELQFAGHQRCNMFAKQHGGLVGANGTATRIG